MDAAGVRTRRARRAAGVLSVIALAAVFAAVGRVLPGSALPRIDPLVDLVPHINAALSVGALLSIGAGVGFVRRGRIRRHRIAMLAAFVQFVAFLTLYLYKVVLEGPASFPGPEAVYMAVYLPLLAIHVLLAIVCVPLLFYVLSLAVVHPVSALPRTDHPRVGRVAAALWAISFGLGLVVYALLYVVY